MYKPIKKLSTSLAFSIFSAITGYLAAYLTSNYTGWNLQDVMFVIGISIISLAAFFMVGGNSTDLGLQGLGQQTSHYIANVNLETTRQERESTNYHNSIKNHRTIKASFNGFTIILGGIFIILTSIII
ncbi:hypothetical protein [Clostridium cellulovorans]|uniref:DUF3899 domain-containing protein n=1 Tax=Clostridium cellulovorans (strain ATCC 35296 / DSM 3052 / OCM 3 / 743B) TaxID=573061 RepID=D9SSV9_CLOC7|nr:hypothetical protein [Clostridium cellulovorans]ADL52621.1 hypothetical protein Clocel_2927 [Clostridium cellulovorans 743B]